MALGIQGKTNFTSWSTQELREWVEDTFLYPQLQTIHNMDTCLQAVEELNIREGVYEELEMLY